MAYAEARKLVPTTQAQDLVIEVGLVAGGIALTLIGIRKKSSTMFFLGIIGTVLSSVAMGVTLADLSPIQK